VRSRLADRGIKLDLTDEAKNFIIDDGYNPDFGARPLKRSIEKLIEDPLSEEILRGAFDDVKLIRIEMKEDHLSFQAQSGPPGTEEVSAGSAESPDQSDARS